MNLKLFFGIIILGLVLLNCFGIFSGTTTPTATPTDKLTIPYMDDRTFSFLNKPEDFNAFKQAWIDSPTRQAAFLDTLNIYNMGEFYKGVLKQNYQTLESVDWGNLYQAGFEISLDEKMENIVIKDKDGKSPGFKIPVSPTGSKIRIASIKQENGKIKIAYDPTYESGKKSNPENYRTISISPGVEGSIDPKTGEYLNNEGKTTGIFLLNGKGGEISLTKNSNGKTVFGIAKREYNPSNQADKDRYNLYGMAGLDNVAVVQIGKNYFYGLSSSDSTFTPLEDGKVAMTNGEVSIFTEIKDKDGKLVLTSVGTIMNFDNEAIFNPSNSGDTGNKDIRFKNLDGKLNLEFGKDFSGGATVNLYKDFETINYGASSKVDILYNGNKILNLNNDQVNAPVTSPSSISIPDSDTVDSTNVGSTSNEPDYSCGSNGCNSARGPVRAVLRGAATGVGAVGRGTVNFFQRAQPIRTVVQGVGTIGSGAVRTSGRVLGGAIRAVRVR